LKFVTIKKTRVFILLKTQHYAKKSKKGEKWAFLEKFKKENLEKKLRKI
jgi:hypothetical protein